MKPPKPPSGWVETHPHPLARWLRRQRLSLTKWADAKGLRFQTIYPQLAGTRQPTVSIMQDIERGTRREVTVTKQVRWFAQLRRAAEKK